MGYHLLLKISDSIVIRYVFTPWKEYINLHSVLFLLDTKQVTVKIPSAACFREALN
jgi:hypothetical protein